jgi:hypothetical protein
MCKILILLALLLIVVGCALKTNGDLSKYQNATEDIQAYAERHIAPDWFAFLEPVGQITLTGVELKKAKLISEEERSTELTVLLKGYYSPMASTSEKERKQFKLKKRFIVVLTTYGNEEHYNVTLAGRE